MSASDEKPSSPAAARRLTTYMCPGEPYSISRSIHLARLAAFYAKCQDCEHRFDIEPNFLAAKAPPFPPELRVTRPQSLVTEENVRGVYLNDLDRNRAIAWGEAFAARLWEAQPMQAARELAELSQIVEGPAAESERPSVDAIGPKVIVGFDERPSSPDIVTGVVLGLRRMGCHVIDLGQTSFPLVAFHLRETDATAGLYVTGAGGDPALTGFDFLDRGSQRLSIETLQQIEQDSLAGVGRQTRQIGRHIPQLVQSRYESSLVQRFHALRPLRIVCGTATRLLPRILDPLFSRLPCTLTHVSLPIRKRNLSDVKDVDLQRVARSVVDHQQHLGLVIDEDGEHAAFVTDQGRLVTVKQMARIFMEFTQRENHTAKFLVAASLFTEATGWLEGREATAIDGGETATGLVQQFVSSAAVMAFSADGRIWFHDVHPTCDALLVMAQLLQVLSLSDAPFSAVVNRLCVDP